jgi:hypothetical protein
MVPTNVMPHIGNNFLPKTSMSTTNPVVDSAVRTKSANTIPRQRTGLLG